MSMPKGAKISGGYATVAGDEGENYRTIAEKMTSEGHPMNHASARNWVLRVMRKFADEFCKSRNMELTERQINAIARSPNFQSAISSLIQKV